MNIKKIYPSQFLRGTVKFCPEGRNLMGILLTDDGRELFFETRCYLESPRTKMETLNFIKTGDRVIVKALELHRKVLRPTEFYKV